MDKNDLVSGMLVKITFGKGAYGKNGKWAAIVRVISVNTYGEGESKVVGGIQYRTIATRGGEFNPKTHFRFGEAKQITTINSKFNDWWETFNAKILV